jgi:hypothetical protein
MPKKKPRSDRPGWGIIDRYMPDASPEKQEEAYEKLKSLVSLLVRIDDRLQAEDEEQRTMQQPPLFR